MKATIHDALHRVRTLPGSGPLSRLGPSEGAAALAAYRKLRASKFFGPEDSVVLFNTGSGLKYLDVIENERRRAVPVQGSRQMGGIIGPY